MLAATGPQRRLNLRTPDGETVAFKHVESQVGASGARIWLGHAEHGDASRLALLVFDHDRVIGRIDQAGRPALRLTNEQGRTWLVQPDAPAASALVQALAAASTSSDYLMSPTRGPQDPAVGSAEDERQSADLVIGYTKGFTARFDAPGGGGRAQLAMYLDMLSGNINAALNLGKVNARTRIVRTVEVDCRDTTDDLQALRELTGADGVGGQPRLRRVATGARYPRRRRGLPGAQVQRSAGRALRRGVDDRRQSDRGGSRRFGACVLGVQLGSRRLLLHRANHGALVWAQPRAAARSRQRQPERYGAFSYSFGYVSGPATNNQAIRTAMSYPVESPQYRGLFSTPDRKCYEQTCGVRDEADNARAARQTFPILASFRAKKIRGGAIRGDFDMNGGAELYWRNTTSQEFAYWTHALPTGARGFSMISPYDIAAIADFSGDGRSDVLWKSDSDHYLVLWVAKGEGYEQREIGGFEPGMSFVGVGDFDGDERYDLAWRNFATGQLKLWLMRGETILATRVAPMRGWYDILGIGDFAHKGSSDLVYADASDVNLYVNDGAAFRGVRLNAPPAGWTYATSADMDGDGRDDMLWVNDRLKLLSYWQMDG